MKKKFQDAEGRVLFIDEAYSLVEKRGGNEYSYGQEAIDVMVEELGKQGIKKKVNIGFTQ